jgi:hypothetical protein
VTPVWWMVGLSGLSWLVAAALLDTQARIEVLYGMLGPLAMVIGSWVLMERAYRRNPERLTGVMVAAFAGKLVFFGAYVAVMLRVLSLRPRTFVASFTSYFIALYLIEALYLRRLFAGGPRATL